MTSSSRRAPPAPAAQTFGLFDRAQLPPTKLALLVKLDDALRRGDAGLVGALWIDESVVPELCPDLSADDRASLEQAIRAQREAAAKAFQHCLSMGEWKQTSYFALNYGSRVRVRKAECPSFKRHEKSELFYSVGQDRWKAAIRGATMVGTGHALAGKLVCSKRAGAGSEPSGWLKHVGKKCPGQPWPLLTQTRGPCPSTR